MNQNWDESKAQGFIHNFDNLSVMKKLEKEGIWSINLSVICLTTILSIVYQCYKGFLQNEWGTPFPTFLPVWSFAQKALTVGNLQKGMFLKSSSPSEFQPSLWGSKLPSVVSRVHILMICHSSLWISGLWSDSWSDQTQQFATTFTLHLSLQVTDMLQSICALIKS